jgi:hypothetical protein
MAISNGLTACNALTNSSVLQAVIKTGRLAFQGLTQNHLTAQVLVGNNSDLGPFPGNVSNSPSASNRNIASKVGATLTPS